MDKKAAGNLDTLTQAMHLLSDATRLRLLLLLGRGESNVSELCDRLRCNQPTASHHLGLLRTGGMVETRRDGKRVYYRLAWPSPAPGGIQVRAGEAMVSAQPR